MCVVAMRGAIAKQNFTVDHLSVMGVPLAL